MRTLRWFVAAVLLFGTAFASVAFVLANAREVQIDLPFLPALYKPLWLVIAAAFFLGALAASVGLLFQLGRKSLAVRRSEKRAKALQAEVETLRAENTALQTSAAEVAPNPKVP